MYVCMYFSVPWQTLKFGGVSSKVSVYVSPCKTCMLGLRNYLGSSGAETLSMRGAKLAPGPWKKDVWAQGLHSNGPWPTSSRKSSTRASKTSRNSTRIQFESTSRGKLWTTTWAWSVGARLVGAHAKTPSTKVTVRLGP